MKSRIVVILTIITIIAGAWLVTIKSQISKKNRIKTIVAQIQKNDEVRTYKRNNGLYKELMELDGKKLSWYKAYADNFKKDEKYDSYMDVCQEIVSAFPENIDGYEMLMEYYWQREEYEKIISLYKSVPETLKKDKRILKFYSESEWKYKYISCSYEEVGTFGNKTDVVKVNKLYGYMDEEAALIINPTFEKAMPLIEKYAAVYKNGEWYFIDSEGDRILATKEKLEELYSMSENYAVAKLNGKYGYVNESFKKRCFEYDMATNFYNGVAAVKKSNKWALINKDFEKITDFIYEDIIVDDSNICSRAGIIFAKKDGSYKMLGLDGKSISNLNFEDAKLFYAKLAAVKVNGKWGFVDKQGKKCIEFQYEDAKSFKCGLAPIKVDGKWGYINEGGVVVVPCNYNDAAIVSNKGSAIVKMGDYYRCLKFYKYDE